MSTKNKPTPHPHAELIKAWADGAKVQRYSYIDATWMDVESPIWHEDFEYRVKPAEPSNEPWKPKDGEDYYLLSTYGEVTKILFKNNCEFDLKRIELGNYFRTYEEASNALARVKDALRGDHFADVSKKVEDGKDTNVPTIDGKPLTPGEIALIKALRNANIRKVFPKDKTCLCYVDIGMDGKQLVNNTDLHIAFETTVFAGNDKDDLKEGV